MQRPRYKELRKEFGLTQETFCEKFSLNISTYRSYEQGVNPVPLVLLESMADFYDVSIDYLLGRTDIRYPYAVAQNGDVSLRIKCKAEEAPAPNGAGAETRTISLDAADIPQSPAELLIECFRQIAKEELAKAMQGK